MINPADDAAAQAHAQLAAGETLGAAAADSGDPSAPVKRRGRPKLPPGQKGTYNRRQPKADAPARAPRAPKAAAGTVPASEARDEERRKQRGKNGGWLRVGGWGEQQKGTRSPTVLREKAREVLAELGYPELANIITDPTAKDSDKLRAVDILMKASVGYMTPEQALGEDAPELPPPIFQTVDGALPGDEEAVPEDVSVGDGMAGESKGEPAPGAGVLNFPQAGPVETMAPPAEPSGPVPYAGGM